MTLKGLEIEFVVEKEETKFPYEDEEGELHEEGKIKNKDFLKRGTLEITDEYSDVEYLKVWVNIDGSIVIKYENFKDKIETKINITGDNFKAVTRNTNEYRQSFYPDSLLGRIEKLLNVMF